MRKTKSYFSLFAVCCLACLLSLSALTTIATSAEDYVLDITTTEDEYDPGDQVTISGSLKEDGSGVSGQEVGVEIRDPLDKPAAIYQPVTNEDGYFLVRLTLPDEADTGLYTVYAIPARTYAGPDAASTQTTFQVGDLTCSQLEGDICRSSETCDGDWLDASDTNRCCSTTCSCEEDWDCTEWSDCEDGVQTRKCTDDNDCGTEEDKPEEERSCSTGSDRSSGSGGSGGNGGGGGSGGTSTRETTTDNEPETTEEETTTLEDTTTNNESQETNQSANQTATNASSSTTNSTSEQHQSENSSGLTGLFLSESSTPYLAVVALLAVIAVALYSYSGNKEEASGWTGYKPR